MPVKSAKESLDTIGALVRSLQKRAKEESDPGGYDGDTSHATKDTENGTVDVSEGSRSSENEGDIKHDQPAGVDVAAEGMPGGQEAVQLNIGTQQLDAEDGDGGNVPSVGDGLPDPGGFEGDSSHPTADKPNTEKYGSARALRKNLEQVKEAGTALLAKIVMAGGTGAPVAKKAGDSVLPPETPGPASGSEDATPSSASVTGGSTGGSSDSSEKKDDADEKEAADGAKVAEVAILAQRQRDASIVQGIAETLKSAQDNAVATAEYLNGFFARAAKGASDEDNGDSEGGDDKKKDDSDSGSSDSGSSDSGSSDSGGGPPSSDAGGGDSGGGGSMDEGSLMQLLGGDSGGGAPGAGGGGMASQDIGGQQAASSMLGPGGGAGGDPMGGAGGAPGMGGDPMAGGAGGMGGAPGMGGGDDQALAMLAEALAQLGIQPQQLEAATMHSGAGKLAASKAKLRVGSWAPRTKKEAEQFESIKKVVSELVA